MYIRSELIKTMMGDMPLKNPNRCFGAVLLFIILLVGCADMESPTVLEDSSAQTDDGVLYQENTDPTALDLETWASDGFSYISTSLALAIKFPSEWEDLITIYDCDTYDGEELESIRIDLINGWNQNDPENGHVGSICRFPKSKYEIGHKAECIPDGFFEFGQTVVISENENDVIVLKAFHGTVNYPDISSQGYCDCEKVYSGLVNGTYELILLDE